MAKIFLSYRRNDTQALAGRITDTLRNKFGNNSVYLDIDTAPPGVDFRNHIRSAIEVYDIILVLIGDDWLSGADGARNRLFEQDDAVRLEIETSLSCNVAVVPLLAGDTQFPDASAFPDSMKDFANLNALRIDEGVDFHAHMDRLSQHIRRIIATRIAAASAADGTATANELIDLDGDRSTEFDSRKRRFLSLTPPQSAATVLLILMVNSILAAFGSMLWGEVYYWPAFMVSALACAYLGWLGVLVAALSPVVSSLLMIGGAPAYLYIPSNMLQAVLVVVALKALNLDPGLRTIRDKALYVVFCGAVPSIAGSVLSWELRKSIGIGADDPGVIPYAFYWTVENITPILFPGFWLHSVISTVSKPFRWEREGYLSGWIGRSVEYTAPWLITLLLSLSICLYLVSSQVGHGDSAASAWSEIQRLAGNNWPFHLMVLGVCIMILVSIGFSVRHARQSWRLDEAIKRHMSSDEDAAKILLGQPAQSARKLCVVIVVRLLNCDDVMRRLKPNAIIDWINQYYDQIALATTKFSGRINAFSLDDATIVFGSSAGDISADHAVMCATEYVLRMRVADDASPQARAIEHRIALGVHIGPVIAGDVGPADSRRYMIVGDAVVAASLVCDEAASIAESSGSAIVLSSALVRELGLGPDQAGSIGLEEGSQIEIADRDALNTFFVANIAQLRKHLSS